MIPYFQFNYIDLGFVHIQVWGLFVALGILTAVFLMTRLAKRYFLSEELLMDMAVWVLIGAFLFARVFHIVFYSLDYYLLNPGEIIAFWHGGASSLGGFFGAMLAFYLFIKKRKLSWKEILPYADVGVLSLWLGWGIGRIGCFLIHDHPGTLSHFVLAVNFPTGARHDLGLYESIVGFVLFGIFALFFKRLIKKGWGLVAVLSAICYAVIRFCLDFLRASDLPFSDARYGNLTPAQWGMMLVVFMLTAALFSGKMGRQK